jgi:phage terminase small subunit
VAATSVKVYKVRVGLNLMKNSSSKAAISTKPPEQLSDEAKTIWRQLTTDLRIPVQVVQ